MIRYTGARIKRVEDPRLLRGQGRYVDDLALPRMLHVAFVRSPHPHAVIRRVETSAASRTPGVVAVITADDLRDVRPLEPRLTGGAFIPTRWSALADGRVNFAGEAVAAVVGESAYATADGRESVAVEYEPLPAVTAIDAGNVVFRRAGSNGDVEAAFEGAAIVLEETFTHGRCAPSPMEPRGLVADWDGEALTVWASTQTPRILRTALAGALGLPDVCVRVIVPDVGGGFGIKVHVFPEDVAVAAIARRLHRPVKWIEERREMLAAASHAREQRFEVTAAADRDGHLLALRSRVTSDAGAYHIYPLTGALEPMGSAAILPGPYVTPAYAWDSIAVGTSKPPLGACRGVGMTMGAFVMERVVDLVAERLGLDPAEVRRRNLIPREAYPFTSASGMTYDSGDYPKALEQALALADYDGWRREQAKARAQGRLVGVGVACYTEYTGMGADVFRRRGMEDVLGIEAAAVKVGPDGSVSGAVSFPSQGQGHATALAQVVADRLGVPMERVTVEPVDSRSAPLGTGTFGSRGAIAIGGTAGVAADRVREKMAKIAAQLLEASPADLVFDNARIHVRGLADRALGFADVARVAYAPPKGGLVDGLEPGLHATVYFDPPGPTFSGAVHLAMVEVDRETGRVGVKRYALVEDCGPVINPLLVDGQIHGAIVQGVGEALLEGVVYDDSGQLLTATLMDYALPRADDVPAPAIAHLETPAPHMPGGVKGMGRGARLARRRRSPTLSPTPSVRSA